MVKTLMSTVAVASVAADDLTSLLQLSASVRQSQGQLIVAAIAAEGTETICVPAAVGDIAPVSGSFTASGSQQVVVVEAGSMANAAGSFCVTKQDVLLIQRTWGLNTARDFEVALDSKKNRRAKTTTTTTTAITDWDDFDFAGDLTKNVTVKADGCPNVEAGLLQTVDASVSDKQRRKADKNKLDADQLQACECRNFLKSAINTPNFVESLKKIQAERAAAQGEGEGANSNLLQRNFDTEYNFDTALASKKPAKKATTTTTTTTTIDHRLTEEFAGLAQACTKIANKLGPVHWTTAAKEINNPLYRDLFKEFNITGGWQHCNQGWKVQGACRALVLPTDEVVGVNPPLLGGAGPTDGNADGNVAGEADGNSAGPMRTDDAGDADGDEGGCAANTNVSAIICPGLKTLCVNGFFRSGTVTVKDVDVALKAVGGDDSIVQALSTPFEKFDLSTIDITMPSFKDTKSMFLAHKWAYGIVDPVSRDFNQTKFDILASFAKDGRIGLAELKQADETMFTEFRKDEAAGKIHGFNAEEMMVPSFAVAGYLEIFGEADPDTGLKSVKASELHDAYSSGKIPEDWEKASASMRSPTIGQAGKNMMARMQKPWPEQ